MRYSVTEKEILAIVWAVHFFRHYIYCLKIIIYTDHKPLVHFQTIQGRLARLFFKLQHLDFEIIYRPGKLNGNADALSRIVTNHITLSSKFCWEEWQDEDESLLHI